ncbi:MAG: HypC/HybG/HupF family hydrogenase formation chaperone, partial [Thiohalorhabdaceae bacterium]
MCLTVPMQIQSIDRLVAHCAARGVEREVSLLFLQAEELAPGDYVLVQLGEAVAKVSAEGAEASWALLDEILAAQDG